MIFDFLTKIKELIKEAISFAQESSVGQLVKEKLHDVQIQGGLSLLISFS